MAEQTPKRTYNNLWQNSKFKGVLFEGNLISLLVNDVGYLTQTSASGSYTPLTVFNDFTSSYVQDSSSFDTRILANSSSIDILSGSFETFTQIYNTGSFTGSFIGDGSQLTGLISSKWSGSNPITRDSDVEITGSLSVSGSIDVTNTVQAILLSGSLQTDRISFTQQGTFTGTQGDLGYSFDDGRFTFYIENDVPIELGQTLYARVRNADTVTLTKGTIVDFTSTTTGQTPRVKRAIATSGADCSCFIGVVLQDIGVNNFGAIMLNGVARGLNLTSFNTDDQLYLSSTVSGSATTIIPTPPIKAIRIGKVLNASNSPTQGVLYVRPENRTVYFDLDEFKQTHNTGSFSGSFTGSFQGDGSQLTGIVPPTVGTTGADYTSIQAAVADGKYILKQVGEITETQSTSIQNEFLLIGNGDAINLGTNQIEAGPYNNNEKFIKVEFRCCNIIGSSNTPGNNGANLLHNPGITGEINLVFDNCNLNSQINTANCYLINTTNNLSRSSLIIKNSYFVSTGNINATRFIGTYNQSQQAYISNCYMKVTNNTERCIEGIGTNSFVIDGLTIDGGDTRIRAKVIKSINILSGNIEINHESDYYANVEGEFLVFNGGSYNGGIFKGLTNRPNNSRKFKLRNSTITAQPNIITSFNGNDEIIIENCVFNITTSFVTASTNAGENLFIVDKCIFNQPVNFSNYPFSNIKNTIFNSGITNSGNNNTFTDCKTTTFENTVNSNNTVVRNLQYTTSATDDSLTTREWDVYEN